MRIAVLSDVHGSLAALDAVLADVEAAGGVDRVWALGDLVALGPEPVAVLERLDALPEVACTRGNTERYVLTGDLPRPTIDDARADPKLVARVVETAASFAWTRGMLTAAGLLDRLAALPLELRETLPDGTRLLGVHASPGRDDGAGIRAGQDGAELDALLAGADADVVCTGHTHVHVDRLHRGVRLVNLGSLSLPPPDEPRASYAIVEATADGVTVERRLVAYDHGAVVAAIARARPPGSDFLLGFFDGRRPL